MLIANTLHFVFVSFKALFVLLAALIERKLDLNSKLVNDKNGAGVG